MPILILLLFLFYIRADLSRYLFSYLAVGFLTASLFLSLFKWGERFITVTGFICILSSIGEFCGHVQLGASLLISFLIFIAFFSWDKFGDKIRKFTKKFLGFGLAAILLFGFWLLAVKYDREEFNRYEFLFVGKESREKDIAYGWKWMDEASSRGLRIAYTGRAISYPLFGQQLKNDIYYISVNDKLPLPHYYPDGLYRKEKNFIYWTNNLESKKIDYLFIMLPFPINNESTDPKEFPIEDKWARENPEIFKLVFSNSKVRIYLLEKKF